MNKRANLPIEGKAIRIAPGRSQEPASRFWKFWGEGDEVYASARTAQGLAKISVHASGQIHWRLGPKLKQDLAPITQLGNGPWKHAFEIRFLLSQGANVPPNERESLKNKSAYLIPVPQGLALYANLIVGAASGPIDFPLPAEFAGGQALWRTQLRDGRPVALVGRMLPLDSENLNIIRYLRETLKPTVTFFDKPRNPYVEIFDVRWSAEGGNIVLVVPMGEEAIRSEKENTPPTGATGEPRTFRYESPRSRTEIVAPNGLQVALLEIDSADKQVELIKNLPRAYEVGTLKLFIDSRNLIAGSKFMAAPCRLVCIPTVNGGSPRDWTYTVFARFDGFALSVELYQLSASLRNSNLTTAVRHLQEGEEFVMTAPWEPPKLVATLDNPVASVELLGRFTLRDVT